MVFFIAGYIFILFNFTINNFDILNDAIGFIFFLIAVNSFKETNYINFAKIIPFAIGGIIANVIIPFVMMSVTQTSILTLITSNISPILLIFISLYIVKGIREMEDDYKKDLRQSRLKTIWTVQTIVIIISIILEFVVLGLSYSNSVILLTTIVASIGISGMILQIVFVVFLYSTTQLIKYSENLKTAPEYSYESDDEENESDNENTVIDNYENSNHN